jgi:hypothetical protein
MPTPLKDFSLKETFHCLKFSYLMESLAHPIWDKPQTIAGFWPSLPVAFMDLFDLSCSIIGRTKITKFKSTRSFPKA